MNQGGEENGNVSEAETVVSSNHDGGEDNFFLVGATIPPAYNNSNNNGAATWEPTHPITPNLEEENIETIEDRIEALKIEYYKKLNELKKQQSSTGGNTTNSTLINELQMLDNIIYDFSLSF